MLEVKWVVNQTGTRSHAFVSNSSTPISKCGTCSRLLATMEKQVEASDDAMVVDAYLEQATQLVVGQDWTYAELATLPTWRETVDRVATALTNERRSALVQVRSTGRHSEGD
jgi:hypothetical protein